MNCCFKRLILLSPHTKYIFNSLMSYSKLDAKGEKLNIKNKYFANLIELR